MWFPEPLDPARQTRLTATLPEPNESRGQRLRGVLNPVGSVLIKSSGWRPYKLIALARAPIIKIR